MMSVTATRSPPTPSAIDPQKSSAATTFTFPPASAVAPPPPQPANARRAAASRAMAAPGKARVGTDAGLLRHILIGARQTSTKLRIVLVPIRRAAWGVSGDGAF